MSSNAEQASPAAAEEQADRLSDRNTVFLVTAVAGAVFGVLASTQAIIVFGVGTAAPDPSGEPVGSLLLRIAVNLATVALIALLARASGAERRELPGRIGAIAALAVSGGVFRAAVQLAFGLLSLGNLPAVIAEAGSAAVVASVVMTLAVLVTDARRRLRETERARARQRLLAIAALESLRSEELRVRRQVADSLHGSVQNAFVVLAAQLEGIARRVPAPEAEELSAVIRRLDVLREQEVRSLSRALYPAEIRRGVVAALRALLGRLPASIEVEFTADEDRLRQAQGIGAALGQERGILLVRVAEEALSNALRHGGAGHVRLVLSLAPPQGTAQSAPAAPVYCLVFEDDGSGGAVIGEAGGLARLREQLALYGGGLRVQPSELGGSRIEARLPAS